VRRALPATALLLAPVGVAACAQLVGVGDVPEALDAAVADATLETGADAAAPDVSTPEGPDGADAADARMDAAIAVEAAGDAAEQDASPDIGFDAAMCPPWDPFDMMHCGPCGQEHCCSALAACEARGDAGPKDAGSRCEQYLACRASYAKSGQAGAAADTLCQAGKGYAPSDLALADAALACIQASCPDDCDPI
jgi:hypothetical protein